MRTTKTTLSAVLAWALSACATGTYTAPGKHDSLYDRERIVYKSFDETWGSLVEYTSKAFFGIDNVEKSSGLITLSFGSSEPERFIDCGHFKFEGTGRLAELNSDSSYVEFLRIRYGATFAGKMNLFVKAIQPNETMVRVNARYVLSVPREETYAFDSGGESTLKLRNPIDGTPPTRTCRPTYAAEKAVLEALGR